jgi:hypothetical protein
MMVGGVEVHEMHGGRVVRLADIQALPIWGDFEPWIQGQTCLRHAGEPWVYLNDWRRFLRQQGLEDWPRADPAELERFDPETKVCVMNCGPAAGDPRSAAERKLLCDDCEPANPKGAGVV